MAKRNTTPKKDVSNSQIPLLNFQGKDIVGMLELNKKPKGCTIVEGFPGLGLIGSITTEFLINHLKTEKIGTFWFEDMPAAIAIHKGKLVPPIELHYNKTHNLVILHALTAPTGSEWKISDLVMRLARELKAKEILSLEGVGNQKLLEEGKGKIVQSKAKPKTYFFTNEDSNIPKLKEIAKPLKESIIMGVTGALLIKEKDIPTSALFIETSSSLPDSKASAEMIKSLNKYLGMKVNPKPLLKTAEEFEAKFKQILDNHKEATELKAEKHPNYFG